MDQRGLARSGLAGVKNAAWLAAFFLKNHRSPSAQELGRPCLKRNGRMPVLDDWMDRYGELRYQG